MKPKYLFVMVALAICLVPAAIAIGQETDSGEAAQEVSELPSPSPQLVEMERAHARGDQEALQKVTEEVRAEILEKLPSDEREAAEKAPPAPEVPPGTLAYVSPHTSDETVKECEEMLASGREDPLCELVVMHGEGKLRAGAFSAEEVESALGTEAR